MDFTILVTSLILPVFIFIFLMWYLKKSQLKYVDFLATIRKNVWNLGGLIYSMLCLGANGIIKISGLIVEENDAHV